MKKYRYPLILFLLTLIFFNKLLFHPNQMIFPASDIVGIYSFRESFIAESVKKFGEIPLWNPYMFGGQPFTSSEIALFYPLNILFFILPTNLAFGYIFAIDIFLIGLFTYLFAKKIGLSKFASLISSIISMFNGTVTLYIFPGHISHLNTLIWFPLLLLFYELGISQKKLIYGIFSGIVIALMLLAGSIQIAIYGLISSLLYFIFRYISTSIYKTRRKIILIPIISILIGLCLSAIELIPSMEFSRLSTRADGLSYNFASDFSLHPYQLITFFLPHFFGSPLIENTYWGINGNFWSLCGYTGIFSIVLVLIAIIIKKNKFIYFFLFLAIFSLFFSMGRFGFIFPFFYNHIPTFDLFRVPARFLYVYGFSISILSGIGIDVLVNITSSIKIKNTLKKIMFFLLSILVLSFSIFIFIILGKINLISLIISRGYAIGNDLNSIGGLIKQDIFTFIILLSFIVIVIFLKVRKLISLKHIKLLLIIGIFADLLLFSIKFYTTENPEKIFKNNNEINYLIKDHTFYRVLDFNNKFFALTGKNRIQSLTGFESLYLHNYRDFLWLAGNHLDTPYESFFSFTDIDNLNILKLLNVKYIISDKFLKIFNNPDVVKVTKNIYEIKDTLPRAYIAPNAIIASSKNFDFKKLSSYKEIKITNYEPNKINLSALMNKPGYLVLSEVWFPGWKAFVNGKQTEIYKANLIFRSIYLNKGKNDITFIFDPFSYKIGKFISISSFIIIAFYLIVFSKQRKHKLND